MARLDLDKQLLLEPLRMDNAIKKIEALGYKVTRVNETEIQFTYGNRIVKFYPYSGWATGSSIKDGRGLRKLLRQLK